MDVEPISTAGGPPLASDRPPGRPRALIVDGHVPTAAALAKLLDRAGYETRTATGFAAAVRLAAGWEPDLVVCDADLDGDRSGCDVLRVLRRVFPNLLGVAMSGHAGDAAAAARSTAAGYVAHLTKPFAFGQLAEVLGQAH